VLAFQVVALVALEMNVYIVTDSEKKNSTIPKLVKHMNDLSELNELKPEFLMKFSSEYGGGEFEFPGS